MQTIQNLKFPLFTLALIIAGSISPSDAVDSGFEVKILEQLTTISIIIIAVFMLYITLDKLSRTKKGIWKMKNNSSNN